MVKRDTANFERAGSDGAKRLFGIAVTWAHDAWGGGLHRLGPDLYAAVLSQQVLTLLALQDDNEVSDIRVRSLLTELRDLIDAEVNTIFN